MGASFGKLVKKDRAIDWGSYPESKQEEIKAYANQNQIYLHDAALLHAIMDANVTLVQHLL